ncbi:sialic acid-binding Ig-like lectin 7 [Hylobates moloch]|uniref:sialic acid-binding Ig-like lectin 7 n=1 Tax=Hylobates moloch TaxID=81572 RepID=UPI0026760C0F|nr:sialic acid-binding Ig-like lectin 7 [Hylobates moloch]
MNTGILPWPETNPARSCKREARTLFISSGTPRPTTVPSLPLSFSALTQAPDIQVPATLESGCPANLTCYVSAACKSRKPLIFSWTWGTVICLGPGTPHFSEITIIPHPWSHGSNITCKVTFPRFHVTTEMTIQLNVSYAPQNLTISVFRGINTAPVALENGTSLSVLKNQSLHLVCVTDSNPPARLSWTREGQALNLSQSSESAVLELPPVESGDGGNLSAKLSTLWAPSTSPLASLCRVTLLSL